MSENGQTDTVGQEHLVFFIRIPQKLSKMYQYSTRNSKYFFCSNPTFVSKLQSNHMILIWNHRSSNPFGHSYWIVIFQFGSKVPWPLHLVLHLFSAHHFLYLENWFCFLELVETRWLDDFGELDCYFMNIYATFNCVFILIIENYSKRVSVIFYWYWPIFCIICD